MSSRCPVIRSQPRTTSSLSLFFALVVIAVLLLSPARSDLTRAVGSEDVLVPMNKSLHLQTIRDLADAVRTCYNVPGLAIGFSLGGERHSFGLGVADVESGTPVTEHTVFGIGSLTKAFSSALLAELLPTSGLNWNSPLKDFIPGFRLNTTLLTEHVTLADALTHRTGIAEFIAALFAGYPTDVDRRMLERRAQYFKPTLDFRTAASYNNHMYALGSSVVEHLTGMSWEQLIVKTLFMPLNMTNSSFGQWWKNVPNLSKMYSEQARGGNVEMPFEALEYGGPIGPAGCILSTANDMLKWLDFALEKTAAKSGAWPQVFTPHVPFLDQTYDCSFGIGWIEGRYGDISYWQHGGSNEGYCSMATLLHHHNITTFVTANKWCGAYGDESNGFQLVLEPLTRFLVETLLGLPVTQDAQSICALRTLSSGADKALTSSQRPAEGDGTGSLHSKAPCWVGSGEGRFLNPGYGDMVIASNGSSLRWHYGRSGGPLVPASRSFPEHRSYAMKFEDLRLPPNRQRALPQQLVLTFAEDCGSLWLIDHPEVVFERQKELKVSGSEKSSGDTLWLLLSVLAHICSAKCLLN